MKKVTCIILSVIMILNIFCALGITVSAETSGDFEYRLLNDGSAEITKYKGSATSLSIPSDLDGYKVTRISSFSFERCQKIKALTIPNSVTNIDGYAFEDCFNLLNVIIPASVISIGSGVFKGCTNLLNIDVDADNDFYCSIDGVFYNKNKTELIKYASGKTDTCFIVPNGVENIVDEAFSYSTNLTEIRIPESVTNIGSCAFYGCEGLSSITISNNIDNIGVDAFNYTAYYNNISNWDNNVLYIGNYLIKANDNIEGGYTIKSGTKTIADYAFSNCTNIISVKIPNNIEKLGIGVFESCTSLSNVDMPNSITSIGDDSFNGCKNLKKIVLPSKLENIGIWAFAYCTNLNSITIPDSVKSIGIRAFSNCINLMSTTIGNSVESIGISAFTECKNLTSISIPSNVKYIGDTAFANCTNLKTITIADSVTKIGSNVFFASAYCNDYNNWEDNVLYIGNYLIKSEVSLLDDYTIKNGTKAVADEAFCDSKYLTSVTIPPSVNNIGEMSIGFTLYYDTNTLKKIFSKIENFKIHGYSGTEAETYANMNEFEFISLGETPTEPTQDTEPTSDVTNPTQPTTEQSTVPAAKINKTKASIKAGGTVTLKVTNGTVKTWSTSNKAVATVSKGKVTGLTKGSAIITAKLSTGEKLTCKVTVATSPKLSKSSVSVKKGKTVSVKITGKASTVKNVYTNTKYAKVISKNTATTIKVKGLKKGSTTLKIKVNGVVLKLKVKVK